VQFSSTLQQKPEMSQKMSAELHVIHSLPYFEWNVFTSTRVKILTMMQLPFIPAECPHHCWDSRLECEMCTHPSYHRQSVFSHCGKIIVCSVPGSSRGMPTSWVTMNIDAVFSSETMEHLITRQCRNPTDNHFWWIQSLQMTSMQIFVMLTD